MTKERDALKLALNFIEQVDYPPYDDKPVITAIREALAQPQEKYQYGTPLLDAMTGKASEALDRMAENARELELDYETAQKPVAYRCWNNAQNADGTFDALHIWVSLKPEGYGNEPLYTSPQPAQPPIAWLPPDPPPECQTEAEKTAFAFGWFKALEEKRKIDSALDRMAENARELGLDYEPPCRTGSQCTSKCPQCEQQETELEATERQVEILSDELSKCNKELAALKAQYQETTMNERLFEKLNRLGAEAGIDTMTPEIRRFALLVRNDVVSEWPSKPWVGLTSDEFEDIELSCRSTPFGKIEAMQKVEAKLREKNA